MLLIDRRGKSPNEMPRVVVGIQFIDFLVPVKHYESTEMKCEQNQQCP